MSLRNIMDVKAGFEHYRAPIRCFSLSVMVMMAMMIMVAELLFMHSSNKCHTKR